MGANLEQSDFLISDQEIVLRKKRYYNILWKLHVRGNPSR